MASGVVRITGGELSGRKIEFPEGLCHPMGERERLALFNSLVASGVLGDTSVLDLFAGSGALGLEALSRGARQVTFVEQNPKLVQALHKNAEKFGVTEKIQVLGTKVNNFLAQSSQKFDLIFADPPYNDYQTDFFAKIPAILNRNGFFILSVPADFTSASQFRRTSKNDLMAQAKNPAISGLSLVSEKQYAGCKLLTFSF